MSERYRLRYSCDMAAGTKYRDIVREIALDHYGYVTTKEAADAGVPAVELPKLAARGGLENVGYGLYRVPDTPPHPYDQFVLAMFGLADVNPRQIKVAARKRTRPKLPPFIELTLVKADKPTTRYEGLASQTVADAILECRGRIEAERLMDAARQARKEGLLTTTEWQRVVKALRS